MRRSIALAALLAVAVGTALPPPAAATVFEPRAFTSPKQEAEYKHLTELLRCLVCQNQNIAESEADLAKDLRNQVFDMLAAGKSEQDVIDYMTARYGDFVLYKPPFEATTALLWIGPFALGAGGLVVLAMMLRRRRANAAAEPAAELDGDARERAAQLLGEQSENRA